MVLKKFENQYINTKNYFIKLKLILSIFKKIFKVNKNVIFFHQ